MLGHMEIRNSYLLIYQFKKYTVSIPRGEPAPLGCFEAIQNDFERGCFAVMEGYEVKILYFKWYVPYEA